MRAVHLVLVGLLATLVPTVAADIETCAAPAARSFDGTVVPMLEVNGIVAYIDHACTGGTRFVSGCGPNGCMAACGAYGTYVVGTTYCGPLVAPGGMVSCSWVGTRGLFELITVGFDTDGDGNITAADAAFTAGREPTPSAVGTVESMTGTSLWPDPNEGSWAITNPTSGDARVIVYPTTGRNYQNFGDGYIGCA